MTLEELRAQTAAIDSSAEPAQFLRSALDLADALTQEGQRPGGFQQNAQALAWLRPLQYLVLKTSNHELELAWRKSLFYALSDCYSGDRELHLREAIAHAERALAILRAEPDPDEEELGAFLNDMANCYLRANYSGTWPLEKAIACYRQGLAIVTPTRFPVLHRMLTDNLAGAEHYLAHGRYSLPQHEMARRFDYAIQHALQSGGPAAAIPEVWPYLHWAWSLPEEPNPHLAAAYIQLANYYAATGHVPQSLPYIYSALALCTSLEALTPNWQTLLQQSRQLLEEILAALNQQHKLVELSTTARGSFNAARDAWKAGNQFLTKNPAQALQAYEYALSLFPLWPAGLHARGLAQLLLNKPTDAIDDFNASLQFLPNHPKTLLARSKAHSLAGNAEQAAADLAAARKIDPSIPEHIAGKASSAS